jgi:probable HAF family extracellular repeat protein
MVSLGTLPGGNKSLAYGVNADGSVVVGAATGGPHGFTQRAFRWTDATGMRTVEDWLRDNGATIATDSTYIAFAVSDDGNVVVGQLENDQAFVARIGGPREASTDEGGTEGTDTGGSKVEAGMITTDDLSQSLGGSGAANTTVVNGLGTILNGVGSRPLDRRAPAPGRGIVWVSGDLGEDNHGARDGTLAMGEVGAGHDFGAAQVNVALGQTGLYQATQLGGRTSAEGTYAKIEVLSRLRGTPNGGLWAALMGVGMWGDTDIRRNYVVNGGLVSNSSGKTDLSSYGVRGRLEWENAIPFFSPYGELSWARTCLDDYTESGGAFPASFDRLCDEATEARLGTNVRVPVSPTLNLVGAFEGVHRFEWAGSNVTGRVIGLGGFNLGSPAYERDWLRGGAGFEADLGGSVLSLMLNGTTKGESASMWLAASWRMPL